MTINTSNDGRRVFRRVLELQNERHRLLWTESELDTMAAAWPEDSGNLERDISNIVVARKNYLRFVGGGIKLAKLAYTDSAPEWWRVDQDIATSIRDAKAMRKRA
jgi:hypothetical protein